MPTWLKLIAIAVACARSDEPNQVAERTGGVHWKKGCAAPTSTVPATTCAYCGSSPLSGTPERSRQPAVMTDAAPTITWRRPKRLTMEGSRRQKTTLV